MTDKTNPVMLPADAHGIAEAAARLEAGEVVALPTETVYGLAARADRDESVAQIYRTKGRPDFNPLIVHVLSIDAAAKLARIDARARKLAHAFWPGPLTLVLPLQPDAALAQAVTAGLPTVALRCPAHPVMRAVLESTGLALAAPSANRSGGVSPSCADHVVSSLGAAVPLVLDGGPARTGIESTIVALRDKGWTVLRPGPVTEAQITEILEQYPDAVTSQAGDRIEAPGQLASHYAPGKPVRLSAPTADDDEFHIGFAAVPGHVSLSATGDLAEAASRLYTCLHQAAAAAQPRIAVAPLPDTGIGTAINDRLRRAAA